MCVPETGWNSSIWNPHVSNNAAATAATAAVEGLAGGAVDNGAGAGGVGAWGLGVEGGGALEGGRGIKLVSPQEEVLRQQAVATVFSRFQARITWGKHIAAVQRQRYCTTPKRVRFRCSFDRRVFLQANAMSPAM